MQEPFDQDVEDEVKHGMDSLAGWQMWEEAMYDDITRHVSTEHRQRNSWFFTFQYAGLPV